MQADRINLSSALTARDERGKPIRIALIGAGKFGTMILAQLRLMKGVQLCALADLDPQRAQAAATRVGWEAERFIAADSAARANDVARSGKTALLDSGDIAAVTDVDIVIEATGFPEAASSHIYKAIEAGNHVINVTVEVDVVVGPALYRMAQRNGVIYSLAYGDQPAICCELVDWARTCGFRVVAAGKGTKFLPKYRRSTPDVSLALYGFSEEMIAKGGFNPKMFNSFLDGTKQSIEMTSLANATGLGVPAGGLSYAEASVYELATVLRPRELGGVLDREGVVDCVTSHRADESEIENNLRMGMYVVFTSDEPYSTQCFSEYGMSVDPTGRYASMWRPYHLIGLEVGISIASVALRGEPTGAPVAGHIGEVVSGTRKAMRAGEMIDGEGGYAVYGTMTTAQDARARQLVPLGLSQGLTLKRDVPADHLIGEADVEFDESSFLWKLRREQDRTFGAAPVPA